MSFKPVTSNASFPKIEEKILGFWQKNKILEKLQRKRKTSKKFIFYDGPPFATGLPHYGHILAMSIKDAIVRAKFMQGFNVPLKLGWDCHGLPVEYEVEKDLGISSKAEIEKIGIKKFCAECRKIVFRYTKEWEQIIERMGRLANFDEVYATLEPEYIESVWWVFKEIWDNGLIYSGFKSMPYCPRCATPLSNFETNQGYRDNTPDPSVYVKFQLVSDPKTFLLAWTTTPWTLPGNVALAVNPKFSYVKVRANGEYLILAKETVKRIGDFRSQETIDVKKLIGTKYQPPYKLNDETAGAFKVVAADFVSTEEGTGVVHIAPAFGEDDLELGKIENLPILQTVDRFGNIVPDTKLPGAGKFVKEADGEIISDLEKRSLLFKKERIFHTYPFCWRCETPLIYYAISTWFITVSKLRDKLVSANEKIHWVPEHIKTGRFGKWLEDAKDWAVSRDRFWGAPVPIWICENCGRKACIGSIAELKSLAKNPSKISDLHRPAIDQVKLNCTCGGEMKRVSQVLDCWFESGSMPYGQNHYPFENKSDFESSFPADFIAEGLDQTRGWFYTLHVIATILFSKPAFKNCIVNGLVLDTAGRKLSKRLRNYPEPEEVFSEFGADSLRFLLLSSPAAVGQNLLFSKKAVEDVTRKVLLILWNVYNFFVTYANFDAWQAKKNENQIKKMTSILDRWIFSRLNSTISEITQDVNGYNLPPALRRISSFINDLSTWYVRRSRDRVGLTAKNSPDKRSCYQTLHYVLVTLTKILAPFTPFVADEIYKNLTGGKSVHLSDWPKVDLGFVNEKLENEMDAVRKLAEAGHSARKTSGLKVRQPLSGLTYYFDRKLSKESEEILANELNVKKVNFKKGKLKIKLETKLTDKLLAEGQARELVRKIQEERKKLGCDLTEFVEVVLPFWPKDFEDYIIRETLAAKIIKGEQFKIIRLK